MIRSSKKPPTFIEVKGIQIPCRCVAAKNRQIRLSFPPNFSGVQLSLPGGKFTVDAQAFVREKANWIHKHYMARMAHENQRHQFFQQLDDHEVLYMGKRLKLVFKEGRSRKVQLDGQQIVIQHLAGDMANGHHQLVYSGFRTLAKNHLHNRTIELAEATDSSIKAIRVKDLKSKWGSCSSLTNINLNWHLIFLPTELIDYVIIHELMHLREMNHSPAYWAEVAKYCPDYKVKRKQVKEYGWVIGIFG